jgi:hypothetical protein
MTLIPKPIRIEPAFDNREQIRALFERHAPYPALATYLPEDSGFPSTASSVAINYSYVSRKLGRSREPPR